MDKPKFLLNFFAGIKLPGNIYLALVYRFMLIMGLFTLCRLGFYLFNLDSFSGIPAKELLRIFWGGLRFDLTAIIYTNALFILLMVAPLEIRFNTIYQSVCRWMFFIFNGVALSINVVDFIYYRFTGRRTTADIFRQFENENNFVEMIARFVLDYWYAVLFWVALMAVMIWLYKKIRVDGPQLKNKLAFYSSGVLAFPLIVGLLIGGVRGGFLHSTRPITLNDAGQYVTDPSQVSIVLNTPFAIYRTLRSAKIQKVKYFESEEELNSVFTPVHLPDSGVSMRKLNVVIIILESFSREFIGFYNRDRENGTYKGYAPFLDSLASQSKTFQYSLANGRKSIDALPSVIASIPSLEIPYVLTPYSGNKLNSLGNLLKQEGYHTSFFHGAPNGSMGFSSFMNIAGIDHYVGMDEYPNPDDYDGLWGIWDHKFFQFCAEQQQKLTQPFFSTLFSVSSHHPFEIPKEFQSQFRGGSDPILKCIQYTDYALKQYFRTISKSDWYSNTLFVITADHVSSQILFKDGHTAYGRYSIPILFFRPDNSLAGMDDALVSQIDIMPSVLSYLGFEKNFVAFGNDVLDSSSLRERCAWNHVDNLYHFYRGNFQLKFDGQKSIGLYRFKSDIMNSENLLHQYPDTVVVMEKKIKAIVQQYSNRMIENRLAATEK
jgi:phosphoglycerol transferase MdoB-like AlkP superfamily enzyme